MGVIIGANIRYVSRYDSHDYYTINVWNAMYGMPYVFQSICISLLLDLKLSQSQPLRSIPSFILQGLPIGIIFCISSLYLYILAECLMIFILTIYIYRKCKLSTIKNIHIMDMEDVPKTSVWLPKFSKISSFPYSSKLRYQVITTYSYTMASRGVTYDIMRSLEQNFLKSNHSRKNSGSGR